MVLFRENHISGAGEGCEVGNPGTLLMNKRRVWCRTSGGRRLPMDPALPGWADFWCRPSGPGLQTPLSRVHSSLNLPQASQLLGMTKGRVGFPLGIGCRDPRSQTRSRGTLRFLPSTEFHPSNLTLQPNFTLRPNFTLQPSSTLRPNFTFGGFSFNRRLRAVVVVRWRAHGVALGFLTVWTPVGGAGSDALSLHEDRGPAAAAGLTCTAIDP